MLPPQWLRSRSSTPADGSPWQPPRESSGERQHCQCSLQLQLRSGLEMHWERAAAGVAAVVALPFGGGGCGGDDGSGGDSWAWMLNGDLIRVPHPRDLFEDGNEKDQLRISPFQIAPKNCLTRIPLLQIIGSRSVYLVFYLFLINHSV